VIKPIVTAKQLAVGLTLVEFQPQLVPFDYTPDGYIHYMGRYKVSINPDGLFVACPFCGCPARFLCSHPTRCGLCCVDCKGRAEHKADNAAGRLSTRKRTAKPDEVAVKTASKGKARRKAA
jgi:hypothetical protein